MYPQTQSTYKTTWRLSRAVKISYTSDGMKGKHCLSFLLSLPFSPKRRVCQIPASRTVLPNRTSYNDGVSTKVATSQMWPRVYKCRLIKIKKFPFFSCASHISSAQQPYVANSCGFGQCTSQNISIMQKVLLNSGDLERKGEISERRHRRRALTSAYLLWPNL